MTRDPEEEEGFAGLDFEQPEQQLGDRFPRRGGARLPLVVVRN
jgi:hypothetical protein